MVTAERMSAIEVSGDNSELRCALGIKGEYIMRCFNVRSFMRCRLSDSVFENISDTTMSEKSKRKIERISNLSQQLNASSHGDKSLPLNDSLLVAMKMEEKGGSKLRRHAPKKPKSPV